MTDKLPQLPAYENPPVSEVALSVQFEPLTAFHAVHSGLLWSRFRQRFPSVEQHAPLEHVVERTGVRSASAKIGLHFVSGPEMTPRLWMVNQQSSELIQVQADRFIRNWRRVSSPDNQYPRYESHLRPQFERDFGEFRSFVDDEGLGSLVFDQCEITYVNQIRADAVWSGPGELEKAFVGWSSEYRQQMPHDIESIGIRARQVLKGEKGEFIGRLFVEVDTGFIPESGSTDGESGRVLLLKLIARGRPTAADFDAVMQFMDLGHREIVLAFDRLTSDQMHAVWRKTQ